MNKLMLALLLSFPLFGCDKLKEFKKECSEVPHTVKMDDLYNLCKTKIEGHDYLFFRDSFGAQGSLYHSASCPCYNTKNKETISRKKQCQ